MGINRDVVNGKSKRYVKKIIEKTYEDVLEVCGGRPERKTHTYVSLIHQINEAKAAGYDQDEIVNGVIRAMVPSLTLRNVLKNAQLNFGTSSLQ